MPQTNTLNADLDQSGTGFQRVKVYLGPSLGWTTVLVKPSILITTAGTVQLVSGNSLVLVNVAGLVTLNLPDVTAWVKEISYLPSTGFERAIWIKDLGGNAGAFNISIVPFGTQQIDGLAQTFTIVQNHALARLYPLNDLTGWFVG